MVDLLKSYFGYAAILSVALYGFFAWFGEHHLPRKSNVRDNLALWLMGAYDRETWTKQFISFFETVFGDRHFSLRCIIVSATASITTVMLLYILFGPILGLLDTQILDGKPFLEVLALGIAINLMADYISLGETRLILKYFQNVHSSMLQFLILLGDFFFSGAIIFITICFWQYVTGNDLIGIGEIVGAFTVYSIFFYSTFLTSAWAWLYWLSTSIMRIFSRNLQFLNIEERPFRQLGLIGGGLLFLSFMSFELVPDNKVKELICQLPGETMPYHCLRTASTATQQLKYLKSYLDDAPLNVIEKQLEVHFSRFGINVGKEFAVKQENYCLSETKHNYNCRYPALFYYFGIGVDIDKLRSSELFNEACVANNMGACANLASYYFNGEGVEVDKIRAEELYAKACDGRLANGCHNLGVMNENGQGIDVNLARAAELYDMACDLEMAVACHHLGLVYEEGKGVEVHLARALELYGKSCDQGFSESCTALGGTYLSGDVVETNYVLAKQYLTKACDLGSNEACGRLGLMLAIGEGVPIDYMRAAKLLKIACGGNSYNACQNLGKMYQEGLGVDIDLARSTELYTISCEAGAAETCDRVGLNYLFGNGVDIDQSLAREFFRKACDGEFLIGCVNLGSSYQSGNGGEVNLVRAAELYTIACNGGNINACSIIEALELP